MNLSYRKLSEITKIGYYGTFYLLTSSAIFDNLFDKKPHIFASQPNNFSNTKNKELVPEYTVHLIHIFN